MSLGASKPVRVRTPGESAGGRKGGNVAGNAGSRSGLRPYRGRQGRFDLRGGGRGRCGARRERRGKILTAQVDLRPRGSPRRRGALCRPEAAAARDAYQDRRRSRPGAGRPADPGQPHRGRKPAPGRLQPRGHRRSRRRSRSDLRPVFEPGSATRHVRLDAVGRRAADARHRPRPDGQTDPADAGRALAGAEPQARRRAVRTASSIERRRARHPAGRAEHAQGVANRAPRIRAGTGPLCRRGELPSSFTKEGRSRKPTSVRTARAEDGQPAPCGRR